MSSSTLTTLLCRRLKPVRRSFSYPCEPLVRQRIRARLLARQVAQWSSQETSPGVGSRNLMCTKNWSEKDDSASRWKKNSKKIIFLGLSVLSARMNEKSFFKRFETGLWFYSWNRIFVLTAVLRIRIRIRSDPDLFAGSGSGSGKFTVKSGSGSSSGS